MMRVGRNTNRGYQTSIKPADLPSLSLHLLAPPLSLPSTRFPDARFSVFTTNRWCRVSSGAPETGNPRFTLCVRFRVHVSRGHALSYARVATPYSRHLAANSRASLVRMIEWSRGGMEKKKGKGSLGREKKAIEELRMEEKEEGNIYDESLSLVNPSKFVAQELGGG